MPDLFDTDRAFQDLASDVMGRAAPPSASAAIRQARRRRTARAATAAAAVIAAGVAAPVLSGGEQTVPAAPPAAATGERALPAPAPFAVAGWDATGRRAPDLPPTAACAETRSPASPSGEVLIGDGRHVAVGPELIRDSQWMLPRFVEHTDDTIARERASTMADHVSSNCGPPTESISYPDGQVELFTGSDTATPTQVWVGRWGTNTGYVVTVGTPTDAQTEAISDALMGALQLPASWGTLLWSSDLSNPDGADFGDISAAHIDRAFGGWNSGWSQQASDGVLPCLDESWRGSASESASTPGGGVSVHTYTWSDFDTTEAARRLLLDTLADCDVVEWSIEPLGGNWLVTSDEGSLWIAQGPHTVSLVEVDGGVDPPADVRDRVLELSIDVMLANR